MVTARAHSQANLDGESFRAIAALAYKESGLILPEEKAMMIQSRLRHRLRALGLAEFSAYSSLVASESEAGLHERRHLISALTTNVSHFFREEHHFEKLREVLTEKASLGPSAPPVRVWSAGCSNGQEPLSIAMTVMEHFPQMAKQELRILATDIDPEVLQFARRGTYPERLTSGAPDALRDKYFTEDRQDPTEKKYVAGATLKNLIRFNNLNLLAPWPMKSKFDVIFCRNVLIYFDTQTQERLWPRFLQALQPNGLLFLGHSERIADPEKFGFTCIGPTTYRPISV